MPDLRGFGWTDAPPGPVEPDVFVHDVIALLDALGIEQTDLAGHDWGGFTSLLLAARHPERFRKVVALSDPAPVDRDHAAARARDLARLVRAAARRGPDGAHAAARGVVHPTRRRAGGGRGDLRRAAQADPPRTRLYRSYLSTLASAVRGAAPEPRTPRDVLLMIGENDMPVTPRLAEGLDRGGDHLRFELLPGAGHFVCDTHAHVVAERVRSFL